jgi:hypothetical protein
MRTSWPSQMTVGKVFANLHLVTFRQSSRTPPFAAEYYVQLPHPIFSSEGWKLLHHRDAASCAYHNALKAAAYFVREMRPDLPVHFHLDEHDFLLTWKWVKARLEDPAVRAVCVGAGEALLVDLNRAEAHLPTLLAAPGTVERALGTWEWCYKRYLENLRRIATQIEREGLDRLSEIAELTDVLTEPETDEENPFEEY